MQRHCSFDWIVLGGRGRVERDHVAKIIWIQKTWVKGKLICSRILWKRG